MHFISTNKICLDNNSQPTLPYMMLIMHLGVLHPRYCSQNCSYVCWVYLGRSSHSWPVVLNIGTKPARCDIIQREEKYQQLFGRCTAASYADGVLTYQQAVGSYSIFRPKISKSTRVTIIH